MLQIEHMEPHEAVLRFIELEMEKRGWNTKRLAKEVGMSSSWVSRVLSGQITLSVPMLLKISQALSTPPASLMPVLPIDDSDGPPISFEQLCKRIIKEAVKEEVERALKQAQSKD